MKIKILLIAFVSCQAFAQFEMQKVKAFASYKEFVNDTPKLEFTLKLKPAGPMDVPGGIGTCVLKNAKPVKDSDKISREIWGFVANNVTYINTYHYTGFKGYNPIAEYGYYHYFIGKVPPNEKLQKQFGIVVPDAKWYQYVEYGNAGYVLLPGGEVKFLSPELLAELCKDNAKLAEEIAEAKLTINDQKALFGFLKEYNDSRQ